MTKFVNKSFSVGCPSDVSQERWNKIFGNKPKPGVLRKCDQCETLKYTWEVHPDKDMVEYWCCSCIEAEEGVVFKPLTD